MTDMATELLKNSSEKRVDDILNSLYTPEAINAEQMLSDDDLLVPVQFLSAILTSLKPAVLQALKHLNQKPSMVGPGKFKEMLAAAAAMLSPGMICILSACCL